MTDREERADELTSSTRSQVWNLKSQCVTALAFCVKNTSAAYQANAESYELMSK